MLFRDADDLGQDLEALGEAMGLIVELTAIPSPAQMRFCLPHHDVVHEQHNNDEVILMLHLKACRVFIYSTQVGIAKRSGQGLPGHVRSSITQRHILARRQMANLGCRDDNSAVHCMQGRTADFFNLVSPLFVAAQCLLQELQEASIMMTGTASCLDGSCRPVHVGVLSDQLSYIVEDLNYIAGRFGDRLALEAIKALDRTDSLSETYPYTLSSADPG